MPNSYLCILNASPSGKRGNCAKVIQKQTAFLKKNKISFLVIHLAEYKTAAKLKKLFKLLHNSSSFLFVTGTYWDSWGSPLQVFLEQATPFEGTSLFVGKPAGVVVLNHSVGGKEVLSKLQGVLNTLGCLIPPFSGLVYGLNTQLALKSPSTSAQMHAADFWSLSDLSVILQNISEAVNEFSTTKKTWAVWPVDRKNFRKVWV